MIAVSTWSRSARAKCWTSWSFWYRAPTPRSRLHSQLKRYEKQVLNIQVIEIADVWWKSIATTFKVEHGIHELHVCQSYLMLFNRAVYSLTREMYVAGCELHIQTPTLLIVLTLKTICQRQNHLRKWSSKHQLPASHNLRGLGPSLLLKFFL